MAKAGKGRRIVVTGVKDIDRRLKLLTPALQKKVVRQAVRKSLKPVAAAVKAEAPVRTGATKAAVKVRARKSRKRDEIALEVRIGEGDFKGEQFYAAFNQFGTSRQPANPFMTRAFQRTAKSARAEAIAAIRAGAIKEIKALSKR